ncbi:MAG TPA: phage tail protein [Tepidisphaeraceae bacterium]|jgi:phage tail-like protein|nr:phage tail protein [Tepidisphaeraceae bacterium]
MDANKTRYQLLLGQDDWGQCLVSGTSLSSLWASAPDDPQATTMTFDTRRQQLRLASRLFEFRGASADLSPDLRRGADVDRYGNIYWIDSSNQKIWVLSVGANTVSEFWPAGCTCGNAGVAEHACPRCGPSVRPQSFQPLATSTTPAAPSYAGLAVTSDHYLIVGNSQPGGFLMFDLFAGGGPMRMRWPSAIALEVFDIAGGSNGGAWILDRAARRLWALDRRFDVVDLSAAAPQAPPAPDLFQPAAGGPLRRRSPAKTPQPIDLTTLVPPVVDPIAVCALPDGSILVLDRCPDQLFSNIYRLSDGLQTGTPVSTSAFQKLVADPAPAVFQLTGHDFAFVPVAGSAASASAPTAGAVLGTLTVAASDGLQSFAFDVSVNGVQLQLEPIADYFPMRQFAGKALVASATQVYYDFSSTWIPLVAQKRPRYQTAAVIQTPTSRPTLLAGAPVRGFFDGRDPGCIWHRIMLDASIPPGTTVTISSRAADDVSSLLATAWEQEPAPYLRGDGTELPFLNPLPPPRNNVPSNGTWELLFQNAVGRYLQIQIAIQSDGRDTPRLRAMRIYYPRFSYPRHYLPACYRDDPVPASFIERYLANVEGFYTVTEDKISAVTMLMDSRSVPTAAIEWLIGWFGVAANANWSESNRRLFIKHAMTLFQYRGCIRGLRMALALVLDACPDEGLFLDPPIENTCNPKTRVVESFQTHQTPAVAFGDPSNLTGLRQVVQSALWQPSQGSDNLNARYDQALNLPAGTVYPIRDPGGALSAPWRQFSGQTLGFVPSATASDQTAWSAFLRRQYGSLAAANLAYLQSWTDFASAPIPIALPPDGQPLLDWFVFESVVLTVGATAHLFTVLLPVPRQSIFDMTEQNRRLGLAQQVIALEKPAHTIGTVKFYYALFQIGMARLGMDTSLEQGSRSPDLMPPMVLGGGYLSESYLAPQFPQDARARQFLGQGRLGAGAQPAGAS